MAQRKGERMERNWIVRGSQGSEYVYEASPQDKTDHFVRPVRKYEHKDVVVLREKKNGVLVNSFLPA